MLMLLLVCEKKAMRGSCFALSDNRGDYVQRVTVRLLSAATAAEAAATVHVRHVYDKQNSERGRTLTSNTIDPAKGSALSDRAYIVARPARALHTTCGHTHTPTHAHAHAHAHARTHSVRLVAPRPRLSLLLRRVLCGCLTLAVGAAKSQWCVRRV